PRVIRLRSYELLRDEVHAVAERRDETDVGRSVERRELALLVRPEEIPDGDPVGVAEAAVHVADELLDLAAHAHVLAHARPRRRRDLDERDLAPPRRVELEEARERAEALEDSLGVVEAVDAEDDLPPAQRAPQLLPAPDRAGLV